MRIASVNSYSNVYSAQNMNKNQNNQNKTDIAFGMKFGAEWERTYLPYIKENSKYSLAHIWAKIRGLETPYEKLVARIKALKKSDDGLMCNIRPISECDGDGEYYLDMKSPVVTISSEANPAYPVEVLQKGLAATTGGPFVERQFSGGWGNMIKEILEFLENPEKLARQLAVPAKQGK